MHGGCKSKDPQFLVVPKGITLYFMTSLGKVSYVDPESHWGIFPDKMSGTPLNTSILNDVKERKKITKNIDKDAKNNKWFSIYPPGSIVKNISFVSPVFYMGLTRFDLTCGIFSNMKYHNKRSIPIFGQGRLIFCQFIHLIMLMSNPSYNIKNKLDSNQYEEMINLIKKILKNDKDNFMKNLYDIIAYLHPSYSFNKKKFKYSYLEKIDIQLINSLKQLIPKLGLKYYASQEQNIKTLLKYFYKKKGKIRKMYRGLFWNLYLRFVSKISTYSNLENIIPLKSIHQTYNCEDKKKNSCKKSGCVWKNDICNKKPYECVLNTNSTKVGGGEDKCENHYIDGCRLNNKSICVKSKHWPDSTIDRQHLLNNILRKLKEEYPTSEIKLWIGSCRFVYPWSYNACMLFNKKTKKIKKIKKKEFARKISYKPHGRWWQQGRSWKFLKPKIDDFYHRRKEAVLDGLQFGKWQEDWYNNWNNNKLIGLSKKQAVDIINEQLIYEMNSKTSDTPKVKKTKVKGGRRTHKRTHKIKPKN